MLRWGLNRGPGAVDIYAPLRFMAHCIIVRFSALPLSPFECVDSSIDIIAVTLSPEPPLNDFRLVRVFLRRKLLIYGIVCFMTPLFSFSRWYLCTFHMPPHTSYRRWILLSGRYASFYIWQLFEATLADDFAPLDCWIRPLRDIWYMAPFLYFDRLFSAVSIIQRRWKRLDACSHEKWHLPIFFYFRYLKAYPAQVVLANAFTYWCFSFSFRRCQSEGVSAFPAMQIR